MRTKLSTFFTMICFVLFHSAAALAQSAQPTGPLPPWDWPGHWHMWNGGWGFWWMFPLFMLFMIVFCFALFFLFHRLGSGHHHWGPWHMTDRSWGSPGDPTFSALQLLNERYAKGEIQKAEYEEKKAAILSR